MDGFIPYQINSLEGPELQQTAEKVYQEMNQRRTVRDFSTKAVPDKVVRHLILSASTAPSGANKQPWTFCAIRSKDLKAKIREAAEKEEYTNYHGRMGEEWLEDLKHLGTDWNKPFLEIAPWLIIVFKKAYDINEGEKQKNYYVNESVGLAVGFFLSALHRCGLVALTHTPSPMNFLADILERPENERPFLLIPIGYPAEGALVPDIDRRPFEEIAQIY